MYILDTNHCIFLMNGLSKVAKGLTPQSQNTVKVYLALQEPLNVSAITIAELYYGAYNSDPSKVADNLSRLEYFKLMLNILPLTDAISKGYGEKRVELSRIGKGMTDFDLLIAYTTIVHNATLATNDGVLLQVKMDFKKADMDNKTTKKGTNHVRKTQKKI